MPKREKGTLAHEVVWVDQDDCVDNWWNPNTETAEKFNLLFESIEDLGMLQVIQVVPICEELLEAFFEREDQSRLRELIGQEKKWLVLHGSHTFEAARLAGKEALPELPAVILEPKDVARLKALSVRMNIIKGEIDPEKFVRLYDELAKSEEFTDQALKDMLGIASQKELDSLIKETKKSLPKEMQDELDKAKDEIKTIDDLSRVLNTLFSKFGSDLSHGFMTFTWGGTVHTFVRITKKELARRLASTKQLCRERPVDFQDVLIYALGLVLGAEIDWPEPKESDLSITE